MKARAVVSATSLLGRQILIRALGFAGMLVLARLLTPQVFGIFAVAQFLVVLFEGLSTLGLNAALIRRREPATESELRAVFTAQLIFVLLAAAAIVIAAPWVARHYGLDADKLLVIRVMATALVFGLFKTVPTVLLQRRMRFDLLAVSQTVEYVAYLAAAIGLAYFEYGLWALVAATLLRAAVGAALVASFAKWRPALGFDLPALRALLAFAVPIQLATIVSLINGAVVPVLVGSLFGVSAVGIVNLAKTMLETSILQPLTILGRVQLRVFGSLQGKQAALARTVSGSYFLACIFAFLPAVLLVVMAEPLIAGLLGKQWLNAVPVVRLLAIAYLSCAIMIPSGQALKAVGDSWTPLWAAVVIAVISLSGTWLLAPRLGVVSFPVAMTIAVPIATLLIAFNVRRRMDVRLLENILPALVAAVSAGVSATAVVSIIPGVAGLAAALGAAGVVYVLCLALLAGERIAELLEFVAATRSETMQRWAGRPVKWLTAMDFHRWAHVRRTCLAKS
jgi:PST family polysaccharide transporter